MEADLNEEPWVSADVASAMSGGSPDMGKHLPPPEEPTTESSVAEVGPGIEEHVEEN